MTMRSHGNNQRLQELTLIIFIHLVSIPSESQLHGLMVISMMVSIIYVPSFLTELKR